MALFNANMTWNDVFDPETLFSTKKTLFSKTPLVKNGFSLFVRRGFLVKFYPVVQVVNYSFFEIVHNKTQCPENFGHCFRATVRVSSVYVFQAHDDFCVCGVKKGARKLFEKVNNQDGYKLNI